jgi:hypothetical protein
MDYSSLFPKLFELQKLISRKADLAVQVAGVSARERSYQLELDLRRSIHSVGGARARWNEVGFLEFMREQRERDEATKAEYRNLCERINELTEEIDQLVAAAV